MDLFYLLERKHVKNNNNNNKKKKKKKKKKKQVNACAVSSSLRNSDMRRMQIFHDPIQFISYDIHV